MGQYLASQEVWNLETRRAPGSLGFFCGRSAKEENVVHLMFYWRSLGDYERWMADEHDRIARLAQADAHYERLVVRILDPVSPAPELLPAGFLPEETSEAADVQLWSEAYRATVVVRAAVRLKLFDYLDAGPRPAAVLAAESGAAEPILARLLRALAGMGLLNRAGDDAWENSPLASRTLVTGKPAYQGNIILHNSRPGYFRNWLRLAERLGLDPEAHEEEDAAEAHAQFIRGMANTADGGQADALLGAIDLSGRRRLLDVGGASGRYSIALCREYPQLRAAVLDLPETAPLAHEEIAAAGLQGRIEFLAHDYRAGALPGPADVILLSNVLRGETPDMVYDILRRAYEALEGGGGVIVQDLFPEDAPAPTGLRAALFGLHLTGGANMTMSEMEANVARAGFLLERSQRFVRSVVMNGVVTGRRP